MDKFTVYYNIARILIYLYIYLVYFHTTILYDYVTYVTIPRHLLGQLPLTGEIDLGRCNSSWFLTTLMIQCAGCIIICAPARGASRSGGGGELSGGGGELRRMRAWIPRKHKPRNALTSEPAPTFSCQWCLSDHCSDRPL